MLAEQKGYEAEIKQLEKRIIEKNTIKNLVVFYGSSTIRLWSSLEKDFPGINSLNLGFGGAYISSLSQYFERLFSFESPKVVVLYLGGNDLSLGWSVVKIVNKIITFIEKIHRKFPTTTIINLSIKPSLERVDQMEKILGINSAMAVFAKKTTFLKQIDFFDALMQGKIVNPYFFLQDGLHLNKYGYKVLKNHLTPYL